MANCQFLYLRRWFLTLALIAAVGLQGCGDGRETPVLPYSGLDLTERLAPADAASRKNLQKNVQVLRRGERKDALVLLAPAVLRASLQEVSGEGALECWAAPVFDIGDGIQMNVYLRRGGARVLKGGRYFDPGRNAEDRNWVPVSIPLEIRKGDQLEIEVLAGPQGDLGADWLALSAIRFKGRRGDPKSKSAPIENGRSKP